jgi:hypothetical protein
MRCKWKRNETKRDAQLNPVNYCNHFSGHTSTKISIHSFTQACVGNARGGAHRSERGACCCRKQKKEDRENLVHLGSEKASEDMLRKRIGKIVRPNWLVNFCLSTLLLHCLVIRIPGITYAVHEIVMGWLIGTPLHCCQHLPSVLYRLHRCQRRLLRLTLRYYFPLEECVCTRQFLLYSMR